jgi:nucleoside-diphosphate-sugar epimerase
VKILVTGASGFIGATVCDRLMSEGQDFLPIYRADRGLGFAVGNIDSKTEWYNALSGITHVVHTAARVHVMKEEFADPLLEFRKINVEGTLNLARQSIRSGVKRFIYLSSIKVNGEQTKPRQPFTEEGVLTSDDPYALSKYEAELGLQKLASRASMEVVIIRPPLVYGPGVKANFLSLMKLVRTGWPLPLGDIDNIRSMVSLDNLVDFILTCIENPKAANQTFLISDGEDLSVTELLARLASAMDVPSRLISVPPPLLRLGLRLVGEKKIADRLCGSLQLDIAKAKTMLGWSPVLSVDEGLKKTVKYFSENS